MVFEQRRGKGWSGAPGAAAGAMAVGCAERRSSSQPRSNLQRPLTVGATGSRAAWPAPCATALIVSAWACSDHEEPTPPQARVGIECPPAPYDLPPGVRTVTKPLVDPENPGLKAWALVQNGHRARPRAFRHLHSLLRALPDGGVLVSGETEFYRGCRDDRHPWLWCPYLPWLLRLSEDFTSVWERWPGCEQAAGRHASEGLEDEFHDIAVLASGRLALLAGYFRDEGWAWRALGSYDPVDGALSFVLPEIDFDALGSTPGGGALAFSAKQGELVAMDGLGAATHLLSGLAPLPDSSVHEVLSFAPERAAIQIEPSFTEPKRGLLLDTASGKVHDLDLPPAWLHEDCRLLATGDSKLAVACRNRHTRASVPVLWLGVFDGTGDRIHQTEIGDFAAPVGGPVEFDVHAAGVVAGDDGNWLVALHGIDKTRGASAGGQDLSDKAFASLSPYGGWLWASRPQRISEKLEWDLMLPAGSGHGLVLALWTIDPSLLVEAGALTKTEAKDYHVYKDLIYYMLVLMRADAWGELDPEVSGACWKLPRAGCADADPCTGDVCRSGKCLHLPLTGQFCGPGLRCCCRMQEGGKCDACEPGEKPKCQPVGW